MRAAVLFPAFLGGGAEAVCAWILEALKDECEVTLATLAPITLRTLDEQYGTCLDGSSVRAQVLSFALPGVFRERILNTPSLVTLRQFILMKAYRKELRGQFDVTISAFDEMDFGHRGIQYICAPIIGQGHERARAILGYPDSLLRRIYRTVFKHWSGYSEARMKANLTLTLSEWMAQLLKEVYGINARVIYPPVKQNVEHVDWLEKENGFVLVARVVREKKIESAIRIISEVRKRGYDVHLHILSGVGDSRYWMELRQMSAGMDWIHWEQRLTKEAYGRMLSVHKYGIHSRPNEQFGIGIAEMILAGAIPFVPSEGGQAEIVGYNPHLLWTSEEEAVENIVRVMSDSTLQEQIRSALQQPSPPWLPENFKEEIKQAVADFIRGKV